ncbi:ZNF774 [Cervus elaphus hippelaphus]|uniref:ZNF774 n=1 Tax=Cervus elaphus hippelaphus TaxID=46360 RepID=A0A212CT60_CEREH|nr:ZNF774 [Cervus elaphus hippelaphus]
MARGRGRYFPAAGCLAGSPTCVPTALSRIPVGFWAGPPRRSGPAAARWWRTLARCSVRGWARGRISKPSVISQLEQKEEAWVLPLQNFEARKILRESHTEFKHQVVQLDQDVSETAEPCGTSSEGANKDISPPPSWGGNWERGLELEGQHGTLLGEDIREVKQFNSSDSWRIWKT